MTVRNVVRWVSIPAAFAGALVADHGYHVWAVVLIIVALANVAWSMREEWGEIAAEEAPRAGVLWAVRVNPNEPGPIVLYEVLMRARGDLGKGTFIDPPFGSIPKRQD